MSLYNVINTLLTIGKKQPNILYAGEGDIYEALNAYQDIKYPVFFITQKQHVQNGDFIQYGLNLFIVDRETDDRSNKLQVQSNAMDVLSNILRAAEQYFEINSAVYHTFEERFDSLCAGAFVEIQIEDTQETDCEYLYENSDQEG